MDDTMVVPKVPSAPPRYRRVTTQFAPEKKPAVWPWLLGIAAFIGLAIAAEPFDPIREQRLSTHANEVLKHLP